ncbi:hypothetical protein [Acaryochloris sp. IP29b_bin.137]|uniref:hypothetical protein n=1 Tax=Acaryochloris sp. IP29b_bin.137 TaxID=2969217 RepID=UPI00260B1DAD|nr:hypothetical protein [Acaryochloris sp. IP29b_bin.137]
MSKNPIGGSVLEPCAGRNAISDMLDSYGSIDIVHSSDLLWPVGPGRTTNDATDPQYWAEAPKVDWVVTNPPFNVAEKILPLAYEHADRGVAFLLRLSYLEPCNGRKEWLKQHSDQMKRVIVVSPRIRFRSDTKGSDSVTCAWLIWDKQFSWGDRGLHCPYGFLSDWR